MSKSILFISKHLASASTRYRISQFLPYLQQHGWRTEHHATKADNLGARLQLLRKARHFDIVFIQRKLFARWFLRLLHRANTNLVFDFDDAIFLNDDGSQSPRRAKNFNAATRAAKLVLAGNSYLAAHSHASTTAIFPTGLDIKRYAQHARPRQQNENLTLVWIGSSSTRKYLESHRPLLEQCGRVFPQLRFRVIADFDMQFEQLETECVPWSVDTEVEQLLSADIGIAPMQDDPWTKGKCAFKVIQYMASNLPVISSNTGANRDIVVHEHTGFLANNPDEWIAALQALLDPKLRSNMGEAGRLRAEAEYSLEILARRLDQYLTKLL